MSTHTLIHLYDQCLDYGLLSSHSMFSTESYLHHMNKLDHSSVVIAQQIHYWYTINRHIHMKTINIFRIYLKKKLIHDNFFNTDTHYQKSIPRKIQ